MKLIQVSTVFLFTIYFCQTAAFVTFGDATAAPYHEVTVSESNEDGILSVTASWMVLRDGNCDQYVRRDVTRSTSSGDILDLTSSCSQRRICFVRGPGPFIPIPCEVFQQKMND